MYLWKYIYKKILHREHNKITLKGALDNSVQNWMKKKNFSNLFPLTDKSSQKLFFCFLSSIHTQLSFFSKTHFLLLFRDMARSVPYREANLSRNFIKKKKTKNSRFGYFNNFLLYIFGAEEKNPLKAWLCVSHGGFPRLFLSQTIIIHHPITPAPTPSSLPTLVYAGR